MSRVSAWFRSRPFVAVIGGFVLCGVALHLLLTWFVELHWQRYAAEARARGVKLDPAEFAPPEIPDAENFAALPMFKAIFADGEQRPMELPHARGSLPGLGDAVKGERIDWQKWQKFCIDAGWISSTTDDPVRDVLRGLEHYAPQFKEWNEWPNRPRCRFSLELDKGFDMPLPHLGTFMDAAKLFALRTTAHLALGESAAAYAEFRSGFWAYRALREEPVLIAGAVRIATLTTMLRAVGDGLRDRQWHEAELQQIDADLTALALWQDFRFAFASEHAFVNLSYDLLFQATRRRRAELLSKMAEMTKSNHSSTMLQLVPHRVLRDNQIRTNRYFDELAARISPDNRGYDPDRPMPSATAALNGWFDEKYFFLFHLSQRVFSVVADRYIAIQTQLDATRIAIALERFRLARSAYPETLSELVPEFLPELPLDTYTRQPLIYRREGNDSFRLYGVGKNRTDDGGTPDPKRSERQQADELWLYAPAP